MKVVDFKPKEEKTEVTVRELLDGIMAESEETLSLLAGDAILIVTTKDGAMSLSHTSPIISTLGLLEVAKTLLLNAGEEY